VQQAARTPVYDSRLLVVAQDLDGYVLEIVEYPIAARRGLGRVAVVGAGATEG